VRIRCWKEGLEWKGLRVNMSKTMVSVRVAEWLKAAATQSQSDRESPGSIPGAGKLDSGFQFGGKMSTSLLN
jgi:hypothetical protein